MSQHCPAGDSSTSKVGATQAKIVVEPLTALLPCFLPALHIHLLLLRCCPTAPKSTFFFSLFTSKFFFLVFVFSFFGAVDRRHDGTEPVTSLLSAVLAMTKYCALRITVSNDHTTPSSTTSMSTTPYHHQYTTISTNTDFFFFMIRNGMGGLERLPLALIGRRGKPNAHDGAWQRDTHWICKSASLQ